MLAKKISPKIILLGDSNVGKTAMLRQYTEHKFEEEWIGTFGYDHYSKQSMYEDIEVMFNYIDTAGQERYEVLPTSLFRNVDGVLLVFSLDNNQSFKRIKNWYQSIKEARKIENIQFMLAGNKSDLVTKHTEAEITQERINELLSELNVSVYYPTSAKENKNITECFNYLEDSILKNKDKSIYDERIRLKKMQQVKKKKWFC